MIKTPCTWSPCRGCLTALGWKFSNPVRNSTVKYIGAQEKTKWMNMDFQAIQVIRCGYSSNILLIYLLYSEFSFFITFKDTCLCSWKKTYTPFTCQICKAWWNQERFGRFESSTEYMQLRWHKNTVRVKTWKGKSVTAPWNSKSQGVLLHQFSWGVYLDNINGDFAESLSAFKLVQICLAEAMKH